MSFYILTYLHANMQAYTCACHAKHINTFMHTYIHMHVCLHTYKHIYMSTAYAHGYVCGE